MKLLKARFLIPLGILVVVLGVVGAVFLRNGSGTVYYLVTLDKTIEQEAPVYIENVLAGTVDRVDAFRQDAGIFLIHLKLGEEFSIPSNSRVDLERDGASLPLVRINVLASRDYLKPGDTLFSSGALQAYQQSDRKGHKTGNQAGGLVYRVQLLASATEIPTDNAIFKDLSDVVVLKEGSVYKYYSGNEPTLKKAKLLKQQIVNNGIRDAFIVPFWNNKRISVEEAIKFEK